MRVRGVWPGSPPEGAEAILRFESRGGRALVLASNLPYELWLDVRFVGDGGHRCVAGEALADRWPEAETAGRVEVRVHAMRPGSGIAFRVPFSDPFLADLGGSHEWTCRHESSTRFGARASGYLARQTLSCATTSEPALALDVSERSGWQAVPSQIRRCRHEQVLLKPVQALLVTGAVPEPQDADGADLVDVLRGGDEPLLCATHDLGSIALHRFEIDAPRESPVLLAYSEAPTFAEAWSTPGRDRAHLADLVAGGVRAAAPFGHRGCRYVHVLVRAGASPPLPRAWRRVYPLRWRDVRVAPEDATIVAACRANLSAVVDGGITDTCWRERVQWAGDVRIAAIALRALADAPEVVALALRQLAASFDPHRGMIRMAWPGPAVDVMPGWHLAFCLAALEHDPSLGFDDSVRKVVHASVETWRERYLRDGLLRGVPGWPFTDWLPEDPEVSGRAVDGRPHAVLHGWWAELCRLLGQPSGLDPDAITDAFWTGNGYALLAGNREPCVHATAILLAAPLDHANDAAALDALRAMVDDGRAAARVTAYFAYFVCRALQTAGDRDAALAFARRTYGPMAERLGTLWEKRDDSESRAHGWSTAIAWLLVS